MFQSLFGSLLNYRYGNENVSLRHLSWICITSILTTIYSLKNCSVYGRSCRIYSYKSIKMLQYFQDLGHSFSPYGPPSRQITYMYLRAEIDFPEKTKIRELKKNITTSHRRYPQLRKKNWCQLQLSVVERKFFVLCIGSKYMHLPHKPQRGTGLSANDANSCQVMTLPKKEIKYSCYLRLKDDVNWECHEVVWLNRNLTKLRHIFLLW